MNDQLIAGEQLKSVVERIERLEEHSVETEMKQIKEFIEKTETLFFEKQSINDQIMLEYSKAIIFGLNPRALAYVLRERLKGTKQHIKEEFETEMYKHSLGMV